MLTYFIKRAHNRTVWVRPRMVIGVPSEITPVEKRAVKESAYRAKASEVHLVSRRRWRRRSVPACRSPSRPAT
jgi:rod shape-determining protein MreB